MRRQATSSWSTAPLVYLSLRNIQSWSTIFTAATAFPSLPAHTLEAGGYSRTLRYLFRPPKSLLFYFDFPVYETKTVQDLLMKCQKSWAYPPLQRRRRRTTDHRRRSRHPRLIMSSIKATPYAQSPKTHLPRLLLLFRPHHQSRL